MKSCKKLLCLVLALVMALSLCTVAMADEDEGETTYTVKAINVAITNYNYATSVSSIGSAITVDVGSGLQAVGLSCTVNSDSGLYAELNGSKLTTGYFEAGKYYYYQYLLTAGNDDVTGVGFPKKDDGKIDIQEITLTATVNGESVPFGPEEGKCTAAEINGELYVRVTLPKLTAVPVKIPFTAVTKQGGDVAPTTGSFTLKVANAEASSNLPVSDFTFGGLTYTTSGVASAEKYFTIQHNDYEKILNLLGEGIIVTQDSNVGTGWSHDDTMWGVAIQETVVNALTDEPMSIPASYSFTFAKSSIVDGVFDSDNAENADALTFTNTYTENVETPTHETIHRQHTTPVAETPVTQPVASPKTGDMGVVLYAAMAVSSVLGMGYVSRKKF